MARDVHPEIKRALGASERHSSEANQHASKVDRLLAEAAGKPRKKQPSLKDIDPSLADEVSEVTKAAVRAELERDRAERQKDPTLSGIHVHVEHSEPKRSLSPPGGTASVGFKHPLVGDFHLRGRTKLVAWALAALVVVAVSLALAFGRGGRHGPRQQEATQGKP